MSYGSTSSPARPLRRAESISDDDDEDTLNPPVKYDGHATVRSSVTNLANTVIGAGALAFPSAFAAMGLIPGIISCLASGSLTCFGLYLLSRCATQVGKRPGDEGRKASFNEVARLAFGKKWIMRLFDFAIAVKCFGVSTSYLIICKTLLPKVSETLADAVHHPLPSDSILLSQDFWLVAVMFIIVPLSFLRTLDSLRFASQVALGTVAYLILVVVGWYIFKGPSPNRGAIELGRFKRNTLSAFPIQVFAFTCSQNLFPIYNELKNKTQARMNSVIGISIGMAAASYEVLGIIGYLTFGNKVTSNIIAMYPASSLIIAVGRLGIVLLVGLSYPLQVLPCRVCVNTLTRGIVKTPRAELPTDPDASVSQQDPDVSMSQDNTDEEELNLLPKYGHDGKEIKRIGEIRQWKFYIITVGILTCGFLVALSVDELEVVLGFVGATGSTILSFILPGFFYFKLFRKESGSVKWAALALGIYGLAVMTFCLTFNIINLERRKAPLGH